MAKNSEIFPQYMKFISNNLCFFFQGKKIMSIFLWRYFTIYSALLKKLNSFQFPFYYLGHKPQVATAQRYDHMPSHKATKGKI